jgi:FkbM family methyltransferase
MWVFIIYFVYSVYGATAAASNANLRHKQGHAERGFNIGYHDFGNDQNRMDMKRARELLHSGVCEHVYLDFGTNIGIQIRKLFEPSKYPNAQINPFFNSTFKCGESCHNVCAIGFEPNPKWTSRLKEIDAAYNAVDFHTVIFTETAISNKTGNITFFHDYTAQTKHHEWGSSTIPWQATMQSSDAKFVTVGSLDAATFLLRDVYARAGQTEASQIVVKMDIEGSEWFLIPYLLHNGALCGIDKIFLELHKGMVKNVPDRRAFQISLQWIFSAISGCKTMIMNMDDESYGTGEDLQPLPAPLQTV